MEMKEKQTFFGRKFSNLTPVLWKHILSISMTFKIEISQFYD